MRVERVEFLRYGLLLTRPFRAGGRELTEREGRLVRLTSAAGHVAYGEIAPLPGLHSESASDAEAALVGVGTGLQGRDYEDLDALLQHVAESVARFATRTTPACPSVCFGLQAACAGLLALADGTTPAHVWSSAPRPEVACNALFAGSAADAESALAHGALANYPAVKVKVGVHTGQAEREMLGVLLEGLSPTVRLRLDANRALTLEDAVSRFEDLPGARIEYLEEPLADPGQLAVLNEQTGLSIALDESLRDPATRGLGGAPFVTAWVLKPTLEGDCRRVRALAEEATRLGKQTVVTSTLESGLGLSALAQLAAALPGADTPAGLATEGWLQEDIASPRYDSSGGRVRTADWRAAPSDAVLERVRFEQVCR